MKVYVLTSEYANVDSGEQNTKVVGAYTDYKKAKAQFKLEVISAKEDMDGYNCVEERDGWEKDCWVIEEESNYFALHCTIQIHTVELQ